MDDRIGYSLHGTLLAIVLWLVRKAFALGGLVESHAELGRRIKALEDDLKDRLMRIESLLMERRR